MTPSPVVYHETRTKYAELPAQGRRGVALTITHRVGKDQEPGLRRESRSLAFPGLTRALRQDIWYF